MDKENNSAPWISAGVCALGALIMILGVAGAFDTTTEEAIAFLGLVIAGAAMFIAGFLGAIITTKK